MNSSVTFVMGVYESTQIASTESLKLSSTIKVIIDGNMISILTLCLSILNLEYILIFEIYPVDTVVARQ